MAKIFITGSSDGLGKMAARWLIKEGHHVVLHGRNEARSATALHQNPGADQVLTGDLSSLEETIQLAEDANRLGPFDAVIHNAGVYGAAAKKILMVNTMAPYVLTSLMQKPRRLVYLSSGMHLQARFNASDFDKSESSYSNSKLYVLMLSKYVAQRWDDVYANAVDPGWVPTKMGGSGAPDDLQQGYETQVWLATSDDAAAKVSGQYFFHCQERRCNPEANDPGLQDDLLKRCQKLTGIGFPE